MYFLHFIVHESKPHSAYLSVETVFLSLYKHQKTTNMEVVVVYLLETAPRT